MRVLNLPDSSAPLEGDRRNAPSAVRNVLPILSVLTRVLPSTGRVLEIASGTGQHLAEFAQQFPALTWQPSDVNPENLPSIRAWVGQAETVAAPIVLNACTPGWSQELGGWDAICLTNLLHLISTPEAETLLHEVPHALAKGGVFCLYGPFRQRGGLVSEGDVAFDASLRAQDPEIGYKDIEWVRACLMAAGAEISEILAMPAHNVMVIARRP